MVGLGLDLLTKAMAFRYFEDVQSSVAWIPGFLYITEAYNTGIAFGMLQGHNYLLGIFVLLMALGLPIYTWFNRNEGSFFLFGMGFVYGGALGNLHDRWVHERVRDFIDVRFGSWNYPVFNGADSFICIGVAFLLIGQWLSWRSGKQTPTEA
mgnify:CR=1 FL=1|jgi:signal peptidase II